MSTLSDTEIDGWARSRGGHKSHLTKILNELDAHHQTMDINDKKWRQAVMDFSNNAMVQMARAKGFNDLVNLDPNKARLNKDQGDHWLAVEILKKQIDQRVTLMLNEWDAEKKAEKKKQERYDEDKREQARKRDMVDMITQILAAQQATQNPSPPVQQGSTGSTLNPNLMKVKPIGITPFGGDRLEWIPFWQAYEPTYHKRTDFTDGQKLTALKSLLKGVALEDFKSVDNTDANYPLVIASLQKRYGDVEKLKDEHWAKLENLPPVKKRVRLVGR